MHLYEIMFCKCVFNKKFVHPSKADPPPHISLNGNSYGGLLFVWFVTAYRAGGLSISTQGEVGPQCSTDSSLVCGAFST